MALLLAMATTTWAQGRRWSEGHFPNLDVRTQDGRTLKFYDDVIKDKIVVVSFIFTSCVDLCPLTTARLAQVADKLGADFGKRFHFVSLSVDPENDTPEKLHGFAAAFKVPKGWLFLTGSLADMKRINGAFGERMRSLSEHRNEVIIGNEKTGEWARNSALGDLERLTMELRSMDPEWRPVGNSVIPEPLTFRLEDQPGATLYGKLCSPCHTIAAGDRTGPDLDGVTRRRTRDWLIDFVMRPDAVRAEDSTVRPLLDRFPYVRMPNFGLSRNDAGDLVTYLHARTMKLEQDRKQAAGQGTASPSAHDHHHQPAVHKH